MTDHSDLTPDDDPDESRYPEPFSNEPDEGSPDFSGPFDIDPTFLGQVNLDSSGELFANIYANDPDYDVHSIDLFDIRDLIGDTDDLERKIHFELQTIGEDFDFDSPNIRGPFPDEQSMVNFAEETGLDFLSEYFYDQDRDEYFIELGDSP